MQLQKLLALDDIDVPVCAAHTIQFFPRNRSPVRNNVDSPTFTIQILNPEGDGWTRQRNFRKYAANCKKMSKLSEDPETIALWRRMEERWLLCAKLAEEDEQSAARLHARRTTHIIGLSHGL